MTVDTINENKLRICLDAKETKQLFGSFEKIDYNDPDTRFALNLILKQALPEVEFTLNCQRLYVEVSPAISGGCNIYFTKTNSKAKRYKLSNSSFIYIFEFDSCQDAINASKEVVKLKCSTELDSKFYSFSSKYRMIIESKQNCSEFSSLMKEFSLLLSSEDNEKQQTIEYGKEIISDNALSVLANL
ncbi:MAG: adaptor protein MecA [Clostridia bacterium]|nr:adaptor protein MecA [Clostridia bacterium]